MFQTMIIGLLRKVPYAKRLSFASKRPAIQSLLSPPARYTVSSPALMPLIAPNTVTFFMITLKAAYAPSITLFALDMHVTIFPYLATLIP